MNASTILVVEDEQDIIDLVEFNLRQAGFNVIKAANGLDGLRLAKERKPALVVLDLMLPGLEGQEVCRRLKQGDDTRRIPVLMLTALASETDRIVGFELGADDYLAKPFSPRELVLRVRAILRRQAGPEEQSAPLRKDALVIHPDRFEVRINDEMVALTATEFKLLHHLVANAGRVQTRQQLLEHVWGYEYDGYARTVDTHVRRLRKKIGPLSDDIETIRGIGYRYKE